MRLLSAILVLALLALPVVAARNEAPATPPRPRALLVEPTATHAWLQATREQAEPDSLKPPHETTLDHWRGWLNAAGFQVSQRNESALLTLDGIDVVVLPGTVALATTQLDSLYRFLEAGGGIVASGATGVRSEAGDWRGYEMLESLLGTAPLPAVSPAGDPASFLLRFGRPGATRVPPGYHLRLTPYGEHLYLPADHRGQTTAFWADDGYKDSNPLEMDLNPALVTRELPLGGRIVWLGSTLEGLHTDPTNARYARQVFGDLLRWAAGSPLAGVEAWPEGHPVGVLVHGDIEDRFSEVNAAVDLFTRLNVPSTYNLLVNQAKEHPPLIAAMLESRGELAIHGDDHTLFGGQEFHVQHERLNTAIDFIQRHSSYPAGFRPPELNYDSTTVEVLQNLGFEYLSADQQPDRYYPRFLPNDANYPRAGGITFFPKSELDDYDFYNRYDVHTAGEITRLMIADFERVKTLHGLYKLNYHSQYLGDGELLGAMENLIRYAREKDAWFATAREISRWVWQRQMLRLSTSYDDEGLIHLSLHNDSDMSVRDVVLRVLPPEGSDVTRIAPKSTSRRSTYDVHNGAFFLYLPSLQADEEYTAVLTGGSRAGVSPAKERQLIMVVIGLGVLALAVLSWAAWYFLVNKRRDIHTGGEEAGDDDTPTLPQPTVRTPVQAVRGDRQAAPSSAGRPALRPGGPNQPAPARRPGAPRPGRPPQAPGEPAPLFTSSTAHHPKHPRQTSSPGLHFARGHVEHDEPASERVPRHDEPPPSRAGTLRSTVPTPQRPAAPNRPPAHAPQQGSAPAAPRKPVKTVRRPQPSPPPDAEPSRDRPPAKGGKPNRPARPGNESRQSEPSPTPPRRDDPEWN